ncbi:MAG: glucose-1-phosphate thymidylyltransferase [Pirellulaceae bacterium]|nr:glucose-1-phosphate thymidylyltransferase [Pirellulaceae bacterium]
MSLLLFEDQYVTDLYPITISRPAYTITCGSFRLMDWIEKLDRPVKTIIRRYLREIEEADFPAVNATTLTANSLSKPLILVNARLLPSAKNYHLLAEVIQRGEEIALWSGECLAIALLPNEASYPPATLASSELTTYFDRLQLNKLPRGEEEPVLLRYPHEVVAHHMEILGDSLVHRLEETGKYEEVDDGVFVAKGAELGPYCVTDSSQGPVILDENVTIGPYSLLSGPLYIGPNSRVLEHSAIKDAVSLGHTTKIGGEVEASIIEPFTNKQHHGFLGHSYLGSWINLGAGTCNSDLKNTYGTINMDYSGQKVATGMQFMGCIIGDYSKTAINTSIFTGKTIGACSMAYGFVTTNVPSFVNYARSFGQVTEIAPEVMVATQQRMFARRKVDQREADRQLMSAMYDHTRYERQLADEPLSL